MILSYIFWVVTSLRTLMDSVNLCDWLPFGISNTICVPLCPIKKLFLKGVITFGCISIEVWENNKRIIG